MLLIGHGLLRGCLRLTQTRLNICAGFSTTAATRRLKIGIVGSGPAALYTAQYVLKNLPNVEKSIDIYEKLPVPFGLVRYGVLTCLYDKKNWNIKLTWRIDP